MADKTSIQAYMKSPETVQRFREIIGGNANAFITSVLIAVANSDKLQACTPQSVVSAAIQAATLRMSVDPTVGEADLIPRKGKAVFQLRAKGIYRMAVRTGKYRYINDSRIYDGETIVENRITGLHTIEGAPTDKKNWHAWLLAFELRSGLAKTFVMTRDELIAHGEKYGGTNDMWTKNFEAMACKTMYRLGLTRYGIFDPYDQQYILNEANVEVEDEEELPADSIDVTVVEDTEEEPVKQTEDQIMLDLGFTPDPPKQQAATAGGVVVHLVELIDAQEHDPTRTVMNEKNATSLWACLHFLVGRNKEKLITRLDGKPFKAITDCKPETVQVLYNHLQPIYDQATGQFKPGHKENGAALKAEVDQWQ